VVDKIVRRSERNVVVRVDFLCGKRARARDLLPAGWLAGWSVLQYRRYSCTAETSATKFLLCSQVFTRTLPTNFQLVLSRSPWNKWPDDIRTTCRPQIIHICQAIQQKASCGLCGWRYRRNSCRNGSRVGGIPSTGTTRTFAIYSTSSAILIYIYIRL